MNKKILIFIITFFLIFFLALGTFFLFQDVDNKFTKKIKDFTPVYFKEFLKKTFFYLPTTYRELVDLRRQNLELKEQIFNIGIEKDKYENKLKTGDFNVKIIKTNLNSYKLESFVLPFYDDKNLYNNKAKGYLDMYNDNILVIFASGKSILIDKLKLKRNILSYIEIDNNILSNSFFKKKNSWAGVKGIRVYNDFLYVSLTREIKTDCYNTSVLYAKINTKYLDFKNFFLSDECVELKNTYKSYPSFNAFNGYQTGGVLQIDYKNVYLTHGDYNDWEKPQDENSIFGKVISVNRKDMKYKILSKGHRNNQGSLLFNNKFLIVTEHGPKGGDEINLIDLQEKKMSNFGWPIASYGNHYDSVPLSASINKIAPLKKSHTKYGFTEPAFFFDNSVGISQIVKNYDSTKNSFFVSSLKNKKIYNIEFDENFRKPKIAEILEIGGRIRDLVYDKTTNQYYLFQESTSQLLILSKIN